MLQELLASAGQWLSPLGTGAGIPVAQVGTLTGGAIMPLTVWILAAVIGAIFGSFLHVVASRFLADESIITPASHCPACKHTLGWGDNIPILGWLLLGGKCRYCKAAIPVDVLITEIVTALAFMAVLWKVGLGWQTLLWLFLACNLVVIFITDLKEHLIFQINSLALIPAGLLLHIFGAGALPDFAWHAANHPIATMPFVWGDVAIPYGLVSALGGMLLSVIFFEGTIALSRRFLGTDGFGHGDTHLMMGIGAFIGAEGMLVGLFLGFILQTILAFPILAIEWVRRGKWVILLSGLASGFFALLPYFGKPWLMAQGMDAMTIMLGSLIGSVVALLVFLKELRNQESYVYVPLGPALILGSVGIMLFKL